MAWYRCTGGGGSQGGGNYTDTAWDGSLEENVYIDKTNGNELPYTGWSATKYIDISGQTTVYRSGKIVGADYNAWYDSSKTFISGFGNGSADTVPANAAYVRYSQSKSIMTGKIFTEYDQSAILFPTILSNGVVSTDSAYATATFNDISNYRYIYVRLRDTVSGIDYSDVFGIRVDSIPVDGLKLTFKNLHTPVRVKLYTDHIVGDDYSGSYYYIYADIIGTTSELFT